MPPKTAEVPEIAVAELSTGELGDFSTAAVVNVGASPTGPTVALYLIADPNSLVAVTAVRKYFPPSPEPIR